VSTCSLNGASGNLHTSDPRHGGRNLSAAEAGERLARDVQQVLAVMTFENDIALAVAARILDLPYRTPSADEIQGRIRGAQRFVDPAVYDRCIPALMAKVQARGGVHRAEVQVLAMGDYGFVAVPGEIFVEYGLQIKTQSHPAHALVVSCANGRVGYIPTQEAFTRGGYETTFGPSSMLAPEAGAMVTEAAVDVVTALYAMP
jgi:neutral ceramidase